MSGLWMNEQPTTELASTGAFNSNQLMRRPASIHDRHLTRRDRASSCPRMLRVLVVDDERDMADALVRLVRLWGHAAHVARDGHAALRVAAAQNPDVVLLDLDMPFMDGRQVARNLRLDFPNKDCLIIAVSERADDVRRQPCLEGGADLVLTKPVDRLIVETLLVLECVRVNRRSIWKAATTHDGISDGAERRSPAAIDTYRSLAKRMHSRLT